MAYGDSESSVQDGAPTEIYTITAGSTAYRFTSGPEDVSFGGHTYTAIAIDRGNQSTVPLGQERELTVSMPVGHALVQVLLANGIPPRETEMVVERFHPGTSAVRIFRGAIESVETEDQFARLKVPSSSDRAWRVRLPVAVSQPLCNHALYDAGCGVDRDYPVYQTEPFMTACAVVSVSGVTIVVDNMDDPSAAARPDQWARFGEVRRVSDGERRSIVAQVGTTLTVDVPFGTLAELDDIEVYAGCDHTQGHCMSKFNNMQKWGAGLPSPRSNPHSPTGFGVNVST